MASMSEIKVKVIPDLSNFTDEILDQLADKIVERMNASNTQINVTQNLHTALRSMIAEVLRRQRGRNV